MEENKRPFNDEELIDEALGSCVIDVEEDSDDDYEEVEHECCCHHHNEANTTNTQGI